MLNVIYLFKYRKVAEICSLFNCFLRMVVNFSHVWLWYSDIIFILPSSAHAHAPAVPSGEAMQYSRG